MRQEGASVLSRGHGRAGGRATAGASFADLSGSLAKEECVGWARRVSSDARPKTTSRTIWSALASVSAFADLASVVRRAALAIAAYQSLRAQRRLEGVPRPDAAASRARLLERWARRPPCGGGGPHQTQRGQHARECATSGSPAGRGAAVGRASLTEGGAPVRCTEMSIGANLCVRAQSPGGEGGQSLRVLRADDLFAWRRTASDHFCRGRGGARSGATPILGCVGRIGNTCGRHWHCDGRPRADRRVSVLRPQTNAASSGVGTCGAPARRAPLKRRGSVAAPGRRGAATGRRGPPGRLLGPPDWALARRRRGARSTYTGAGRARARAAGRSLADRSAADPPRRRHMDEALGPPWRMGRCGGGGWSGSGTGSSSNADCADADAKPPCSPARRRRSREARHCGVLRARGHRLGGHRAALAGHRSRTAPRRKRYVHVGSLRCGPRASLPRQRERHDSRKGEPRTWWPLDLFGDVRHLLLPHDRHRLVDLRHGALQAINPYPKANRPR